MLKRAYDILFQLKEYAIAGVLIAVSFFFLAANDTRQIQTIRSLAVVSVGFLQDTFSFIPNYFGLRRENEVLHAMNLRLSDEVNRLREARLENIRLRQLLTLADRPGYRYLPANVIGRNLQVLRSTITIDVGTGNGVAVNMPIVTESGLVGKVVAAGSRYAIGQLLLNRDVRVSAKVQRTRIDGIIRWNGGRFLSMENVAKTLDVLPGDVIITSDYSSIFPPGIRVGVVESARQIPGSLFQNITVAPAVDFFRLEQVAVLTHVADSARTALESKSTN